MMNYVQLAQDIRSLLNNVQPALGEHERRIAVAVGLGRAISLKLGMPSSEVDNVFTYYMRNHEKVVTAILDSFNEVLVIDTRLIRDLAMKFFKLRYDLVYNASMLDQLISGFAIGARDFFPDNVRSVLEKELGNVSGEDSYYRRWTTIVSYVTESIEQAGGIAGCVNDTEVGSPNPLQTVETSVSGNVLISG